MLGVPQCTGTHVWAVALGGAETFAVLARQAVWNTGASTVAGDVGVGPGGTVTGLSWTAGTLTLLTSLSERTVQIVP